MKIINNKDVTKSFWRCEKRSTILKLQKVLESVKHEKIINNINFTKGIWECEIFGKNKQYYCYQMRLRVGEFGKKNNINVTKSDLVWHTTLIIITNSLRVQKEAHIMIVPIALNLLWSISAYKSPRYCSVKGEWYQCTQVLPTSAISPSIVLLHVSLGLPATLWPGGSQYKAA